MTIIKQKGRNSSRWRLPCESISMNSNSKCSAQSGPTFDITSCQHVDKENWSDDEKIISSYLSLAPFNDELRTFDNSWPPSKMKPLSKERILPYSVSNLRKYPMPYKREKHKLETKLEELENWLRVTLLYKSFKKSQTSKVKNLCYNEDSLDVALLKLFEGNSDIAMKAKEILGLDFHDSMEYYMINDVDKGNKKYPHVHEIYTDYLLKKISAKYLKMNK